MTQNALSWAEDQVRAVRDDPHARYELMARLHQDPRGRRTLRHAPYRRAALSFMRWQLARGLLHPLESSPPGSPWWRAVNERVLIDGCEAVAIATGRPGKPSTQAGRYWLKFLAEPTPHAWYRAHNASIVAGYLENEQSAEQEVLAERFFMNVALLRVLYAHALVASPRLALGRLALVAPVLGDPRLGLAGVFLSLHRVVPERYPLTRDADQYVADEQRLGRFLDYGFIAPRLQPLYEWSATELHAPGLLTLIRNGSPIYAWPYEKRHVWRTRRRMLARLAKIMTSAR
jgi:hypothetical protein